MKKNIALVLSCAVAVLGLASCNKETDQPATNGKKHTVIFQAHNPAASETKTALHLQVIPDWRNTDPEDVHIFETETTSGGSYRMEASKVYMDINEDYTDARFTAEFDNATVIVNPPTTKASSSEFKYTAIMATRDGDKYIVPSVQYPDEESWIDPKADVLVGRTDNTYSATLHEKEIQDLNFRRPVALARLAITNLEGSTVTKVKITTANHITGYVTYDQVNFDKKTIEEFDGDDSNKELTILYPAGKNRTTTFYAYFVSVPGAIQFSKIEVYTDKYVFTKTYANSVSISLPAGEFINLPMDMTVKEGGNVTRTGLNQQTLTFVDANQQEVTEPIEYDLNLSVNPDGKDGFVAPTLVIGDDVVDPTSVTIASNNEEVATVDAEGKASLTGATGEATITATVPGDETHADGYASYKIIVTDTTAPVVVASVYTLVTKQDDVVEGKYLIVSASDAYIFDGTGTYQGGYTTIADAEDISIEDNKITINSETAAYDFAFAKSGNGFTITGAKGMIVAAAHSGASTSEETYITFAETGGSVFLQRGNLDEKALLFSTTRGTSSEEYWYYHKDYDIFKIGGSGNKTGNGIHLYFAGERTAQSISFSKTEDTYDMASGDPYAAPTLSGEPKTQVNYSSSDTSVATVDANGAVTIVGKGETTITATAPASSEYLSATASYKLTVVNTNVQSVTYYKASMLETTHDYIIVSNNKALKNNGNGNVVVAEDVTINNNTITLDDTDDLVWTVADADASLSDNGKYTLKNATEYLYRKGGNSTSTLIASTSPETPKYGVWDYVDGYFYNISTSNGTSTYYAYYSNGWVITTTKTAASIFTDRPARELSFSETSVEYDMATPTSFVKPTLNGASGATVKYSSSNETIASVADDGTITPHKKTSTPITITATVAGDSQYQTTSASYNLTIVNSDEKPSVYSKVTAASDLTVGAKYIVVYEGDDSHDPKVFYPFLNGDNFTNQNKSNALTVTISNATITSADFDDCQMKLESGYYFHVASASRYLYPTSNNIGAEAEKTDSHSVTVSISSGTATISRTSNSQTYRLRYSGSNTYFESSTSSANVSLYMLDDGLPKNRNLAFSAESMSVNIYGKTTPYVLTGTPTISGKGLSDVTYSVSSNTDIASVNETTGEVTLLGETGTVTITASAGATSDYQAGSASYTLTITNDAPKYYVLVTGEPASWNGKYLIVNTATDGTGTAMNGSSTASVTISGGKILSNETVDGYALTVASAGEVHPNQTDSNGTLIAYDIKFSDGNWLYWYSREYKQTLETQSSRHNKCTLLYDNGGVRLMSAGYNVDLDGKALSSTPSKNYLRYSSGSYTMGSSYANERVQLYKLEGSEQ